jgi:hypothetical protein
MPVLTVVKLIAAGTPLIFLLWFVWAQAVGKPTQIIHPLGFSTPFSSFIIIERKPKRMAETCRIGRICTSPIFTSWLVYVEPLLELRIRNRMDLH